MRLDIHVHFHDSNIQNAESFYHLLRSILNSQDTIMTTQADVAAQLRDIGTQVGKIKAESTATLQKVADLEAAINTQGNASDEVVAALADLKAQVQAVDDLVPDAPASDTPPTP